VAIASLSLVKSGAGSEWTLGIEALFIAAFSGLWVSLDAPPGSLALFVLIGYRPSQWGCKVASAVR
jgi:hypothetical protein